MSRYAGSCIGEIRPEHVGRPFFRVFRRPDLLPFGKIMPIDAGKRLYDVNGVTQMESTEQRDRRLARKTSPQ